VSGIVDWGWRRVACGVREGGGRVCCVVEVGSCPYHGGRYVSGVLFISFFKWPKFEFFQMQFPARWRRDNAIDAGAGKIEVRVERGGKVLLAVTDDGAGMSREDALLSLERHATSKLRRMEDLDSLVTLGFRGEAVPSIASVSRFRMRTREHGALQGTCVEVEGGVLREVREEGCAPGTAVEVRTLFYNVPARRKFLRAEATEFGHIEQQVRLHATGNPKVAFQLWKDGRQLLHLAPAEDALARVRALLGEELARTMVVLPQDAGRNGVRVWGMLSRPGQGLQSRRRMQFFLNGRPVESPVLHRGLAETYRGLIERGSHPVCVLFLEMDPSMVDINVHPAKREVRFRDGINLQRYMVDHLRSALFADSDRKQRKAPSALAASLMDDDGEDIVPEPSAGGGAGVTAVPRPTEGPAEGPGGERGAIPPQVRGEEKIEGKSERKRDEVAAPEESDHEGSAVQVEGGVGSVALDFRYLGALDDDHEVFSTDEGLVLMERRAAGERIVYEALAARGGEGGGVQALLIPLTVELEAQEFELLLPQLPMLATVGIEAEVFGPRTLLVTALPALARGEDPLALAKLLLEAAGDMSAGEGRPLEKKQLLTLVARQLAGGGVLREMGDGEAILRKLLDCEMPYACPRGRPTLVQIGYAEMRRRFGRA